MRDGSKLQDTATARVRHGDLPRGVEIVPLTPHPDERGTFIELFRQSWLPDISMLQWNCVRSERHVLRGVHLHIEHADYLVLADGHCYFGLYDCRESSPTFRRSALIEAFGESPFGLVIPPGVAHGFYFDTPSIHVYAVSHYWSSNDELGCRFDDPALGIPWPTKDVLLSPRDRDLPPLDELLAVARSVTCS